MELRIVFYVLEIKNEKILIGLHTDLYKELNTQWEVSKKIDEDLGKDILLNSLDGKPYEILLLHGQLPLLENGKLWIWKIHKILKEASVEKNLFIFGCSGIAKSICDTLERLPPKYNEITLVDSNYSLHTNNFYGYKVIKEEDLKHNISNGADVIFAFFKPSDIFNRNNYINDILHDYKLNLVSIIDPLAVISKSSEIGNGSYIASNVFVDSDVSIGRNCIILFNSVISREIKITDNTFISAGCVLKGSIAINESSFISANVSLANNIQKFFY